VFVCVCGIVPPQESCPLAPMSLVTIVLIWRAHRTYSTSVMHIHQRERKKERKKERERERETERQRETEREKDRGQQRDKEVCERDKEVCVREGGGASKVHLTCK
jgi:flagellar biosynthesis component FlhA